MPDPRHPSGTGSPSPGSGGRPFERRALQATLADVARTSGDTKDDTSGLPDADTGVTAGAGTARVGLAGREALAALAVEAAHATLAGRPAPNDATPTAGSPRSGVPGSRAPHAAGGDPRPPVPEERGTRMPSASLLGTSGLGPVRPLAPTQQPSGLRRQQEPFSEPPKAEHTGGSSLAPAPSEVPTIPLRRLAAARSNQHAEAAASTPPAHPGSPAPHAAVTHAAVADVGTVAAAPVEGSSVRPAANAAPWLPTDDDILPRRETRRRSFRSR